MRSELCWAGAVELARMIRARQVSALEVLEAHLIRIERINPELNAVVTLDPDGSRQRAREADSALARGELWGPLHGVPLTLKDGHATAGMRTTAGFPPLADHVPVEDSTAAARLRGAGAVIMGKTNVPYLLLDLQTDNPIFGRTVNPWNRERTPGGSSGGAAAALAAGLTPLEVGSDLGGSIRIPAHFCSTFGFKPTENRVPLHGHIPDLPGSPRILRAMASIGPMARNLEDLTLGFRLLAGPDGRDHQVPPLPLQEAPVPALRELRIAWAPGLPGQPVQPEVRAAVERAAAALEQAGARVEEALPKTDFSAHRFVFNQMLKFMDVFAKGADGPDAYPLADYLTMLHRRDEFITVWEEFFSRWDLLLLPVSTSTAFPHKPVGTPHLIDGREVGYYRTFDPAILFNLVGAPAVALPLGRDSDGLPVGAQLAARRWSDERLLAAAAAVAEITGAFERPPGY